MQGLAHTLIAVLLALTTGLCASRTAAQDPASGSSPTQKIAFHIAAVPVADALKELGDKSGLTVVMYSDLGRGVLASPVIGLYAPKEALDHLLAHTGLRYEYLDARTILILGQ